MIAPVIEDVALAFAERIKVGKLNVDDEPQTAHRYGIRSLPTLLFFTEGQVRDQIIGAAPRADVITRLKRLLEDA